MLVKSLTQTIETKGRNINQIIIISFLFIIITVSSMALFNNYFNLPVYAKTIFNDFRF